MQVWIYGFVIVGIRVQCNAINYNIIRKSVYFYNSISKWNHTLILFSIVKKILSYVISFFLKN